MLRHFDVYTRKSESRLLQNNELHGNAQDAGEGSCLPGCARGCSCRPRARAWNGRVSAAGIAHI